jgi:hypothetical protein
MVVEWMDLKKQRPAAVLPAVDKAPMGCAPDAFKLLLSNIPVSISESALISALSQFGHVVQLGLAQDPAGVSGTSYRAWLDYSAWSRMCAYRLHHACLPLACMPAGQLQRMRTTAAFCNTSW